MECKRSLGRIKWNLTQRSAANKMEGERQVQTKWTASGVWGELSETPPKDRQQTKWNASGTCQVKKQAWGGKYEVKPHLKNGRKQNRRRAGVVKYEGTSQEVSTKWNFPQRTAAEKKSRQPKCFLKKERRNAVSTKRNLSGRLRERRLAYKREALSKKASGRSAPNKKVRNVPLRRHLFYQKCINLSSEASTSFPCSKSEKSSLLGGNLIKNRPTFPAGFGLRPFVRK